MKNRCPVCGNAVPSSSTSCEQCGFKLVGTTQEFLPVKQEKISTPQPSEKNDLQFRVLRGRQVGSIYKLSADVITLGRNPENDIFLNDMTVSRKHAALSKTSDSYLIRDEKSFNGIWVNGKSVTSQLLHVGDVVQIGSFQLLFEREQ